MTSNADLIRLLLLTFLSNLEGVIVMDTPHWFSFCFYKGENLKTIENSTCFQIREISCEDWVYVCARAVGMGGGL